MTQQFLKGDLVQFTKPGSHFTGLKYTVHAIEAHTGFVVMTDGFRFQPSSLTLVLPRTLRGEPTPDPKPDSAAAYPDGNPKSAQGAKKHPLSYMPTAAIVATNEAFADGRAKYGPANWREKGVSNMVYIEAAMRHIALYADGGEEVAADSGAKHLGHAIACLAIILDAESCGVLQDHRPVPNPNLAKILNKEAK